MPKISSAITISAAVEQTDSLSRLYQLAKASQLQLAQIRAAIPAPLFPQIQAGPINGDEWCLLVENSTVAAKLRQLIPHLLANLKQAGFHVTKIRLKVQLHAYSR